MAILDDLCVSEVLSFVGGVNDILEWNTVRKDMSKKILLNLKNNSKLDKVSSPSIQTYTSVMKKKCVICHETYSGKINSPFKIPAHPRCILKLTTAVGRIDRKVIVNPIKLLDTIKDTIPFSCYKMMGKNFTYSIIEKEIPGIFPREKTLEYFLSTHKDTVDAHNSHELNIRKVRSENTAEIRRIVNTKTKEERVCGIEKWTGMKFSEWFDCIPKPARGAVYKWKSVAHCIAGTRLIADNVGNISDDVIFHILKRKKKLTFEHVEYEFDNVIKIGEFKYLHCKLF